MAKDQSWIGKVAEVAEAARVQVVEKVLTTPLIAIAEGVPQAIDKLVPQGAGELAHLLNTGSAYLPYGQGQQPIDPERAGDGHGLPAQANMQQQQTQEPQPEMRGPSL